jgi:hypothetical protein
MAKALRSLCAIAVSWAQRRPFFSATLLILQSRCAGLWLASHDGADRQPIRVRPRTRVSLCLMVSHGERRNRNAALRNAPPCAGVARGSP